MKQINDLLGRLHNQKNFFRPKSGAYIGGEPYRALRCARNQPRHAGVYQGFDPGARMQSQITDSYEVLTDADGEVRDREARNGVRHMVSLSMTGSGRLG